MIKSILFIFVFVLLVSYIQTAQTTTPGLMESKFSNFETASYGNTFLGMLLNDWRTLAMLGIFIGVLLSGFMYMFGEAFDISMLKQYFKIEMKDLFANALLIIFLIVLISLLDFAAIHFSMSGSEEGVCADAGGFCFDSLIMNYLSSNYVTPLKNQINQVTKVLAKNSYTEGITITGETLVVLYGSKGFSWTSQYMNFHLIPVKSAMESAYLLLKVFILALKVSSNVLGPALITLGIFMRGFFFTRRMGSTILAIGIGMLVIFPFLSYLFYMPFLQPLTKMDPASDEECPDICSNNVVAVRTPSNSVNLNPNIIESSVKVSDFQEAMKNHLDRTVMDKDQLDVFLQSIKAFSDGKINKLSLDISPSGSSNVKDFYSCEYIAKTAFSSNCYNINDPKDNSNADCNNFNLDSSKSISDHTQPCSADNKDTYKYYNGCTNFNDGLYCFADCRSIPYPDDRVACRDAESLCRSMYEQYPECFTKLYAYSEDTLYTEILSQYGYETSSDILTYNSVCPKQCRDVPNLIPGRKKSLDDICETSCREVFLDYDGSAFGNSYMKDFKPFQKSMCADVKKSECKKADNTGYFLQSSVAGTGNRIPDPQNTVNFAYQPEEVKAAKERSISITHYSTLNDELPLPYEIKIVPSTALAEAQCAGCSIYQKPLRKYPITVDCSACAKSSATPNMVNLKKFSATAILEVGKVLFISLALPMLIIIATIYATAGLSEFMSGDMFIPSIDKIMPK